MTEKELNKFGLLDEFSITELEQRLEFEAWCDGNCGCQPPPSNSGCVPPPNDFCEPINEPCPIEIVR